MGYLSIIIVNTTDGASEANIEEKTDLNGQKRFYIFLNAFECVKVHLLMKKFFSKLIDLSDPLEQENFLECKVSIGAF